VYLLRVEIQKEGWKPLERRVRVAGMKASEQGGCTRHIECFHLKLACILS
jgi:hypothetical protein